MLLLKIDCVNYVDNIVAVEEEYHVLFHCPTYEFLRTVYISNNDIGCQMSIIYKILTNRGSRKTNRSSKLYFQYV